ncbi:antitoxin Xre/MbcA/ParS toxin-binding domain-containing protein [Mesorhizobium sp.]|uniref:type II RES/Xre toxin-antitoxin system antitoxin n=1 Tax=Mesorhizobium sp. TaxID=1871066 RepID=UPI0025E0EFBB|nr:antitoxin Xre/MbcA/ParS toxin-binding domain-containing protein [Mesorhizobium sp.]
MNYHDLEKAREAARKIPGGSGGTQAARNTGPVIRIAIASTRGDCVMTGLLDEAGAIEKPELADASSLHVPVAHTFVGKWQQDAKETPVSVPTDKVDHLRSLGFSSEELYRIIAPCRTLARRKEHAEPLSPTESDRALRLERIAEQADRVFGNHEKAQRWLRSEIIALDGARPIDLLVTETGAHVVFEELIRIDHGMFAEDAHLAHLQFRGSLGSWRNAH